jgi:hypothetical protein
LRIAGVVIAFATGAHLLDNRSGVPRRHRPNHPIAS